MSDTYLDHLEALRQEHCTCKHPNPSVAYDLHDFGCFFYKAMKDAAEDEKGEK